MDCSWRSRESCTARVRSWAPTVSRNNSLSSSMEESVRTVSGGQQHQPRPFSLGLLWKSPTTLRKVRVERFRTQRACFPCVALCHLSVYEQKPPAVMKVSSPVTPPCSTPVSPLHHPSPTAAPTPKPDRTYAQIPSSLPLPDNAYDMDHR